MGVGGGGGEEEGGTALLVASQSVTSENISNWLFITLIVVWSPLAQTTVVQVYLV